MLIHLTDSVIELNDSVDSAKRGSLNDKVESLVEEIKMSKMSGMNTISQIYIEMWSYVAYTETSIYELLRRVY